MAHRHRLQTAEFPDSVKAVRLPFGCPAATLRPPMAVGRTWAILSLPERRRPVVKIVVKVGIGLRQTARCQRLADDDFWDGRCVISCVASRGFTRGAEGARKGFNTTRGSWTGGSRENRVSPPQSEGWVPGGAAGVGAGQRSWPQQSSRDAEPFRIERISANRLASATIPVCRIVLIALLAVEISMYPRTLDAIVLLSTRGLGSSRPCHPTIIRRGRV